MDRNREARRASIVGSNGFKRRRHRTSSLRGSPDEDLGVELQESIRLRDRVRNDRDRERERERERERGRDLRERDSRSKRRRAERLMSNRDDVGGDETSEESVNDEEDEEDEENNGGSGGVVRLLPPTVGQISNHHHHHHHGHSSSLSQQQHDGSATNIITTNHHLQTRKTFPPSTSSSSKVFKAGPVWKPGDEMIGVSVPRKARTACTKRSHDRISGSSNNISAGGIVGGEQILLQASSSPMRQGLAPSPAAPVSPSSSNASVRKKLKLNSGPKLKPPKVSSKTSSSNPEELEIEIAEVLYGLKTHSQSPSLKKEDAREVNRSSSDTKSHVSSPISNSLLANNLNLASNSSPLSAVAPKRKWPRQVLENSSYGGRSSPVFAKPEMDQAPKSEISSPKLEKIPGSTGENFEMGCDLVNSQGQQHHHLELKAPESIKTDSEFKSTAEESKNNADLVKQEEMNSIKGKEMRKDESGREDSTLTATASAAVTIIKASLMSSEAENQREEKFVIDLMAPPPLVRSSPDKETKVDLAGSDQKPDLSIVDAELRSLKLNDKEEERGKSGKVQLTNATGEEIKGEKIAEEDEILKPFENKGRNLDVLLDLEKSERVGGNKLHYQAMKQQPQMPLKVAKEEPSTRKPGQLASSLPQPMSMATWPGGLPPPMGYMTPLQGVVSMDGSAVTPPPIQPTFSQPRPKRCATHCYIARNINYFQQFMKMNPFWQAAAGSTSLFGSKPGNMNAATVTDLLGNNAVRGVNNLVQEKGQNLDRISSPGGKEKNSQSANSSESAHRKQQIMLQQALPPVAAASNLVGPAFIFPLNQQQAAAATAASSVRPAAAKSHSAASQASSITSRSASASASTTTAGGASTPMSFNYQNMATNETQYLAILQNNAYPFPIPAVGAPPNYRGTPAQAMPLFNGPFYSSQMIHPSQLQHQQPNASQSPQLQQAHQNASASSGSSSTQKHLPGQQIRPPTGGPSAVAGSTNFPAQRPQTSQQIQQAYNQHISSTRPRLVDNEIGSEESPTTDNRGSWASVNIYGQNFAMPIHPQNFALMTPQPVLAGAAASTIAPVGAVGNSEKKPSQQTQQQKSKGGVDSLHPHSFAMSFGTINGSNASPGIDIASMTQNHAVFQNFPEATRQNIQMVAAVAAAQAAQKKNFRISEDIKPGGGDSVSSDAERKSSSGKVGPAQSIAFTRSDLADTPVSSIPVNTGIDSSGRSLNVSTGSARSSRPGTANNAGVGNVQNAHIQAQLQQQQMLQIKQQQQLMAATRKAPTTSNGNVYSDHLNSSSSMSAKFSNPLPGFPQNIVQSSSISPSQSPQWKNPTRTATSQVPSPLASSTVTTLKSHPQQHPRAQPPMHTQISFGGNQKTPASAQGQAPLNNHQAPSPPMLVSSPTTSSISKGSSGSPRTTTTAPGSNKMSQASSLSVQPIKNPASTPSQKSPSILGNPQIASSPSSGAKPHVQQQPHHQQLPKTMQQAQLFFSNPFSQVQTTNPTGTNSIASVPSGYYMQRRRPDQQNQPMQLQQNAPPTSTGTLSLTSSVTMPSTATNDPAKAIAAATCNVKGGGLTSQGVIHAAQLAAQSAGTLLPVGFSYAHHVPAAVQTKPSEHKQSAGNDNLQQWQSEKK